MPKTGPPKILKPAHIEAFDMIPAWTCFIDPGETCGIVVTYAHPLAKRGDEYGVHYGTLTLDTDSALRFWDEFILEAQRKGGIYPNLVIESYRIYPDKAQIHIGKPLLTAEAIGAFKWSARKNECGVFEQPASIKKPMAAVLKGRGVKSVGGSRHAMDAELHMWYFTVRDDIEPEAKKGRLCEYML